MLLGIIAVPEGTCYLRVWPGVQRGGLLLPQALGCIKLAASVIAKDKV